MDFIIDFIDILNCTDNREQNWEKSGDKDDYNCRYITDSKPEYDKWHESNGCNRADNLKNRINKGKYTRKTSK